MGEWDITLYEQKIEGTSKAIYDYDAWGGRDSHISGYAILDTSEVFTIPKITKLSFYQLADIPNKNMIKTIARESMPYEQQKSLAMNFFPIKTKELTSKGIKVRTTYYQIKGFKERSRGYYQYEFENFMETRDSLYFYNLNDVVSKSKPPSIDTLRVKKGNVIIRQWENKKIIEIKVQNLIFSTDGTDEIISNKTYRLKPKTETKSDQFSDYGIYKEKNTVANNVYN